MCVYVGGDVYGVPGWDHGEGDSDLGGLPDDSDSECAGDVDRGLISVFT